jgi:hypothetical protein
LVLLFFNCPNTNLQKPAAIETDPDSLRALEVKCPYCGEEQTIPVRDAYVGGALRNIRVHVG